MLASLKQEEAELLKRLAGFLARQIFIYLDLLLGDVFASDRSLMELGGGF